MAFRLSELAVKGGASIVGDSDCLIDSLAPLDKAHPGSISFLGNKQYKKYLKGTQASAVILAENMLKECPVSALVSDNPYLVYAKLSKLLGKPRQIPRTGIHPSAVVAKDCEIDATVSIGPQCVIESGVRIGPNVVVGPACVIMRKCEIGADTRLLAHVTLAEYTQVGRRCVFQPGVVVGSDGFGLANDNGRWVKIEQQGRVIIGDDVEIGANTTIDRGALEDTVIEEGVKLDNQIQVAHNVRIGRHSAIAGCAGIAGSTTIGSHCSIGGAAGLAGHLDIADHVTIAGFSRVNRSIKEAGIYNSGVPLQPYSEWRKSAARYRQLDDMAKRLAKLEEKLG